MLLNVIIEKDQDGYFARILELEGCVSQGNTYEEALFNIKDDGLYLSYIAVPEPAAFAVMLGALALGLCACRKRK